MVKHIVAAVMLAASVAACSQIPVDQAAVDVKSDAIEAKIVKYCLASGMFKAADGALSAAVPAAVLPVAVVNAGVDKACANPASVADDIAKAQVTIDMLKAFAKN